MAQLPQLVARWAHSDVADCARAGQVHHQGTGCLPMEPLLHSAAEIDIKAGPWKTAAGVTLSMPRLWLTFTRAQRGGPSWVLTPLWPSNTLRWQSCT